MNARRWFALAVMLCAVFLAAVDFNVVTIAIPSIQRVALGPHPGSSGYGRALDYALAWNIWLLSVTFVAAFALPRRQRVRITTTG